MTRSERTSASMASLAAKTATIYYRIKGRDTWHFHPLCHHLQAAFKSGRFDALHDTKPRSGEFCNECLAKARADKRRAKKGK